MKQIDFGCFVSVLLPFLGPLFDALDIGLFVKEVKVFFHSVIHKIVAARKAGTEKVGIGLFTKAELSLVSWLS